MRGIHFTLKQEIKAGREKNYLVFSKREHECFWVVQPLAAELEDETAALVNRSSRKLKNSKIYKTLSFRRVFKNKTAALMKSSGEL